jgi:hypothetical protein
MIFIPPVPCIHKIRYIDTIGIANSKDDEELEDTIQDKLSKDTFLE